MSERGTIVRTSGGVTIFVPDHIDITSGVTSVISYEVKEIKVRKKKK